jgi:hypothetical protein
MGANNSTKPREFSCMAIEHLVNLTLRETTIAQRWHYVRLRPAELVAVREEQE